MRATGAPFEEIGIRFALQRVAIDARTNPEYSPAGKVPVLKIAEGGRSFTVWDSLAICETLAERHPEAKLWPHDAEHRALARSYAAEMHSGFPDLREQLTMEFARTLPTPALRDTTKAQIARIIEAWTQALNDHGDGGFLFGRFSVVDCNVCAGGLAVSHLRHRAAAFRCSLLRTNDGAAGNAGLGTSRQRPRWTPGCRCIRQLAA